MWKPLAVAIVVLATACSPASDETTTTSSGSSTPSTTAITTATTLNSTSTAPVPPTTSTTTGPTTSSQPAPTTTKPAPTTTIAVPDDNEPPTIEIVEPEALSSFTASWDEDRNDNGAEIGFSAVASDPNGDDYTVTWSSSVQGSLGTGVAIVAFISTGGFDASQPVITATAMDRWGKSTSVSIQIIISVPSDT